MFENVWILDNYIQGASSQKLEVVPANEMTSWKAYDLNLIIDLYLGRPFSFGSINVV